jgi:glycosyltransferase involved in cell wall biosynthesis
MSGAERRIAVLAVVGPEGSGGGAERFYRGLVAALNAVPGLVAERVDVVADERTFESIEESYLRCYDLDLGAYDGVVSTKAPSYAVRHPNHVCYLLHTMRVFYDMFDLETPDPTPERLRHRRIIQALDTAALQPPRTRKVFTIGHEVRRRLLEHNGVDSEVIYPALALPGLRPGEYEYALLPGRLHRWKRVDLVIQALQRVYRPLQLHIIGTGEDEAGLRRLAAGDDRVVFHGQVDDRRLLDLYANALVVPFTPIREDFGLVALEALACRKPVVTCHDSGEPAVVVRHGVTGFVCEPTPQAIAGPLTLLFDQRARARRMGGLGPSSIRHIRWEHAVAGITGALFH